MTVRIVLISMSSPPAVDPERRRCSFSGMPLYSPWIPRRRTARLEVHRDRARELAVRLQVVLGRRTGEAQRSGDPLPAQGAGDPVDGCEGTGGVVVPVHVDAVGQADGRVEAR